MNYRSIFKYLLYTIGVFTGFRVLLFFLSNGYSSGTLFDWIMVFLVGLRYDMSAISYLFLPIWFMHVFGFSLYAFRSVVRVGNHIIKLYSLGIGILVLVVFLTDIGFHFEFNRRINTLIFDYLAYPKELIGTILGTFPYNGLFVIFILLTFFLMKKLWDSNALLIQDKLESSSLSSILSLSGTFVILIIFARGGIQQYPMHYGDSNFSDHRVLNQLCLNPVWNLGRTVMTAREENSADLFNSISISNEESIRIVRNAYFDSNAIYGRKEFPLLRTNTSTVDRKNYNVILILLESFSSQLVGSMGNEYGVSLQFDSLTTEGVLFTRMFSTGTRTNRGLSGTLLSFPPLPRNKTILRDAAADQSFSSLAELLKQRNYSTSFVYGGDLRFDNMQGFFRQQGFDTFFGEESFPDTAHRTVYGFADQYVYEKAFDYISNIEEPFFTTILTTSNHPPYTFPEYPEKGSIQYNSDLFKNERLEVFKYSDWALGEFMKNCKSSEFYNNTIFVFTGDHGFLTKGDPDASIDLQMYHVPCLIIAPRLDTQINSRTASHTDIQPTILDLLGGSYKHHSWGKNLLDKKRQDDFALLAPAGLNHIAGIVFEDVFYVHDFTGMHQVFTIESLENGIHLRVHKNGHPKLKDAKSHLFSVLKSASTALFNYTAGIPSK